MKSEKSDKLIDEFSYHEAIAKLENSSEKNTDTYRKLAISYQNTDDYINAERYFSLVANAPDRVADDVYNYASVLKINQKYNEADQWFAKFYEMNKNDSRAKLNVQRKGFYQSLQEDKGQFKVHKLYMNTKQEDFGAVFYKNRLVFTSSNHSSSFVQRNWNWNKLPFLDLQIADIDDQHQLTNIESFGNKVNKKYHEGPSSFNTEGNFMVFTRNNYSGKSTDNRIKLQLFESELQGNTWSEAKPLPYNSDEYSVGHPTLTADGKMLYFASDMEGGIGGVDIYVSNRSADGSWSQPINLGKTVNTEGNEMFPFIHSDGVLFFASDGLPGLGGLDVFAVQIKEAQVNGAPQNLGSPVNSSFDDFALILNAEQKGGYFSSNRKEGKGDDDIYYFDLLKPITFEPENQIVAFNETVNNNGEIMNTENNSENPVTNNSNQFVPNNANNPNLPMGEVAFSLYGLITDYKTSQPLSDVQVTMKDNFTDETFIYTTLASGDFTKLLQNMKLNDRISFDFKIEKAGYIPKNVSYHKILTAPGVYKMSETLDFSLSKTEIGVEVGKALNINPIYFDLDKWNIRPDAATELDKIVTVMNENPTMVIELGSHTDSRQTSEYNIRLSERRAKSSAQYIKERITNPERIYGKGYGETQLVNGCADGVECTEKQHQQNRRTEFKIIKL